VACWSVVSNPKSVGDPGHPEVEVAARTNNKQRTCSASASASLRHCRLPPGTWVAGSLLQSELQCELQSSVFSLFTLHTARIAERRTPLLPAGFRGVSASQVQGFINTRRRSSFSRLSTNRSAQWASTSTLPRFHGALRVSGAVAGGRCPLLPAFYLSYTITHHSLSPRPQGAFSQS
jgi:hypothetical protein